MSPEDTLGRLARLSGLRRRELVRCAELELVGLDSREPEDRLLRRLRRDLGLELEAAAIVVRLVERIEELEGSRPPTPVRAKVLERRAEAGGKGRP